MTVLLFCLKTKKILWFWEVEEHDSQVLDTPGLAQLCWHKVRCLQGGSRASKPVLVQARWHQGQQTCVGAYKLQSRFLFDVKMGFASKPVLV